MSRKPADGLRPAGGAGVGPLIAALAASLATQACDRFDSACEDAARRLMRAECIAERDSAEQLARFDCVTKHCPPQPHPDVERRQCLLECDVEADVCRDACESEFPSPFEEMEQHAQCIRDYCGSDPSVIDPLVDALANPCTNLPHGAARTSCVDKRRAEEAEALSSWQACITARCPRPDASPRLQCRSECRQAEQSCASRACISAAEVAARAAEQNANRDACVASSGCLDYAREVADRDHQIDACLETRIDTKEYARLVYDCESGRTAAEVDTQRE